MRKRSKIIIFVVAVLILLIMAAALLGMNYIKKSMDYTKAFPALTPSASQKSIAYYKNLEVDTTVENSPTPEPAFTEKESRIVNILFLGIDRTEDRDEEFQGVYRTDSIMFASIDLNAQKVDVLSIPRDSYVYIPIINKKDKINHAYVWGGMKKDGIKSTIDTVNNFIKYKKVDYYFAIDREPVKNIVDDFGGVELDVEMDMHNDFVDLSSGYQLLDGEKALEYILFRDSGMGDIDRVKRQQKFIKAMYEKMKKEGNIIKDLKTFLSYSKYMQTDLSNNQMLALASFFMGCQEDKINYYDTPGYGDYINGISYWIPDENVVKIFDN
jgi:cell envelope-related function transcriptional attenuator common domain